MRNKSMLALHRFWFWYHTVIGLNTTCSLGGTVHHINRAEYHETKMSTRRR